MTSDLQISVMSFTCTVDFMESNTACGYASCYLWTTNEQEAAAALYKRYGFILTDEKESTAFGKLLKEQRYELIVCSKA